MIDPIGAFEEIRENLLLYIRTAFATQFSAAEEERQRLRSIGDGSDSIRYDRSYTIGRPAGQPVGLRLAGSAES